MGLRVPSDRAARVRAAPAGGGRVGVRLWVDRARGECARLNSVARMLATGTLDRGEARMREGARALRASTKSVEQIYIYKD